jgi:2',3'-cyclic-nucleotide 2'-phosphodiesterase (5'-nucleotidase family)
MENLKKLIEKIAIAIGLLIVVFFMLVLFIKLLDWLLPVGYQHLPVFIGIPAAGLLSFIVIIIFGLSTGLTDVFGTTSYNHLLPDDIYEIKSHRFYYSVLTWLLCFTIIIFSIYLLWPLTSEKENKRDDGKIDITFLQLNDVYEISPLDHGKVGGMARVATIHKELYKKNKNTYTLLAGDFLSPSAIGTIYDSAVKKPIAGMHMLEALNKVGIDIATFGNHEFDIEKEQLDEAINKSSFNWVSSNVTYRNSTGLGRFSQTKNSVTSSIPPYLIESFKDEDGTEIQIGIIGLTVKTPDRYETYEDYFTAAGNAINEIKGKSDFIVALTHLDLDTDKVLARRFPEIKLIIGGHEHINSYDTVGNTIIAKADANAKTVYIHYLHYDKKSMELNIKSRLMAINNSIEEDAATRRVVDKWNDKAHSLLVQQGFEPCEIIDSLEDPLDGTEASIRNKQTNLSDLIGESLMEAVDGTPPDCSIINSGGIRIDDMLTGYITQYDIFRVLPYKNPIAIKKLSGHLIDSLLRTNNKRKKDGSFLLYYGIKKVDDNFYIHDQPIRMDTLYSVVMNEYLAKGKQVRLEIIGSVAPKYTMATLKKQYLKNDMKEALIVKFKNKYGSPKKWPKNDLKVPCY